MKSIYKTKYESSLLYGRFFRFLSSKNLSCAIYKERDKSKEKNHKDNILSNIDAKIKFVVENSGLPIPPISRPLRSYSYFEIKHRKNKNILIRIFYFRHKDKIVLLNALEKPDNYNKIKEIKKIDKQLKITEEYKNKFILNPKLYEEYQ